MKVLVLGGAGYIGSHMVRLLQRRRQELAVLDNLSTGHREAIGGQRLYESDLLHPEQIEAAVQDFRPTLVVHFAAKSLVAESMSDPALYYANNVVGTHNLLQVMRRCGVQRLVFSSTAAVYGNPEYVPIDEAHPKAPINSYGWSKLFAERMIEDHCRSYGLRAAVLRYFNAAGADADGDIGEAHEPESHLLPNVLRAAVGRAARLTLFGDDHPTPDGYAVRDYIHVGDLCEAHLLAADALERASLPAFQVYNLGTGTGYSVLEVLRAAERIVGRAIPSQLAPKRSGDPASLVAGAERARDLLGWTPTRSDLPSIIGSAWRWHQNPRY